MKLKAVLSALLIVASATAARAVRLPPDDGVLVRSGTASASAGDRLRLTMWNIHKAGDGDAWRKDFTGLMAQSDLAFVQEAYTAPAYREALRSIPGFEWFFAIAFLWGEDGQAGVMSASRWVTERADWYRSPKTEPVLDSPKMAVSVIIPLKDGRRLLAMNVHGINFVATSAFRAQMIPLLLALKNHRGPAIFGGDFNTWSRSRSEFLMAQTKAAGLAHVKFEGDARKTPLDHLFVRGLGLQRAWIRSDIKSSDHEPIQAVFNLVR